MVGGGCAADRHAEPEWLVIPDSAQSSAWRLLHSASKGGARFSVGHASRYPPGQAADAANKAKEYQFEAFQGCFALTTVEMPGCVVLGIRLFSECCALEKVGIIKGDTSELAEGAAIEGRRSITFGYNRRPSGRRTGWPWGWRPDLRLTPDSRAPAQHRAKVGRYRG